MTYSKETHQKQKQTQCLLNKPKFGKVVGIKDGQLLHKCIVSCLKIHSKLLSLDELHVVTDNPWRILCIY